MAKQYENIKPSSRFVNDDVEARFKEFLDFINNINKEYNKPQYLELVASLHWLKIENPDMDNDNISQYLMEKKPEIDSKIYDNAWKDLERYRLIN